MDALMAYRWPGNIRELKNVVERIVLKTAGPVDRARATCRPTSSRRLGASRRSAPADAGAGAASRAPQAEELAALMLKHGESFWSAVYPLFMSRDLTRADLRKIIQIGLETHQRQLPPAGAAVQHADRGLQAVPELPPQARLPPAVPALPRRAGTAAGPSAGGDRQGIARTSGNPEGMETHAKRRVL